MKRSFLGMLVLAATFTFGVRAAEGFDDLVKLVKAGVGEDVLVAFIESSNQNFELNVDDILYLNDIGTPGKVVTAAVRKGGLQNGPLPEGAEPAPAVVEAHDPNAPLIAPRTVPVNEVAERTVTPAVLPPAVPEDYDRAVREVVGQPTTPVAGYPNGPIGEPVIGRPEPVQAAPQQLQPAQPAFTQNENFDDEDAQPQIVEREVVREVVVEKPVYISTNTVVAPPDDQLNVSFFYESLSPYGSWMSIDNEYYWQPSVVASNSSWRPYWDNGSWVYTDYGWTWNSSYSWGWAPFHYGRWNCHPRHGWVWRPDTTWGPAWVHWRSNDAYCGWAPLPGDCGWDAGIGFSYRGKHVALDFHFGLGERDYCFVPYNRFYERDVYRYGARNVYNNTVIVNNYYDYRDRRLVNNGPGYDSVRRGWGRDIKPVRITDAGYRSGDAIRPSRLRDDSLAVYRPNIRRETPETPQAVIARREREQQRVQAERQAQRDRQRTVQATPTRDTRDAREDARRTQVATTDRRNAEANTQRQREIQTRREAESRAQTERQANVTRERIERETKDDQRRAQEQTRTVARENERGTEQARREAQRVQEESRRVVQNEARQQEERQQQARQQQIEVQRRAEQTQRENQRQAERQAEVQQREQAQREQQARQAQVETQRRAEQNQREAQREAQQREQAQREQQARQAQVETQRRAEQNQREAQQQAERQAAQQERLQAQREQQMRQQQLQVQRQAEQSQREAQRQQMQQREQPQREVQRQPQYQPREQPQREVRQPQAQTREQPQRVQQQSYESASRGSMGGRQTANDERESSRRSR